MGKKAIVFNGQGSQYIGMGQDFYNEYEYVRNMYRKASEILGYDLTKVCFKQNDLINNTLYTQPSTLLTSIGIYEVIKREFKIKVDYLLGFSLGEYSALYASGVFDFNTIIKLIKKRAIYMDEAASKTNGLMAAVIGMKRELLEDLCTEVNGLVQIANYNSPSQLVVGGEKSAVKELCEMAKANGAKRVVPLNVSGGFHTPLMSNAASKMYDEVVKATYHQPNTDIIMNCNAKKLDIADLANLMKKQIESSVYFEDSILKLIDNGVNTFIEIGPGNVVGGLIRKIDRSKQLITIDKLTDLDKIKGDDIWI